MANTPPPVNCSRCGEPYSSFGHQCWAEKEKTEARRSAAACSALPDAPGFYWWRKHPDEEWRMVHIVDFAAGYVDQPKYLAAYDVEFRAWGGRTLQIWAKHEPIGEWLPIHKPNSVFMHQTATKTPDGSET